MKADQERVKVLLIDTVTLLCRNGLNFQKQLRVQGVLGITVDDTDVFIVHINESFNEQQSAVVVATPGNTAVVAAKVDDQQTIIAGGGGEPYYMTSLIGTLPQFTQNPIDGSIQMIGASPAGAAGGVNVATRLNNAGTVMIGNQKHKAGEVVDDGRAKRQKSDTSALQQYAAVQGLSGTVMQGASTSGAKLFTTCTALPRGGIEIPTSGDYQVIPQDTARSKDDKQRVKQLLTASGGNATSINQVINPQQWQFTTIKGQVVATDKMGNMAAGGLDPNQCFMQYSADEQQIVTSSAGGAAGKRKVGVYPSLSVPTVSFVAGMNMAQVDFNSAGGSQIQQAGRADAGQAGGNKLWDGTQQQAQQQLMAAGVFDTMTGCAPWTVQQLMTSQGLLQADDQQQTQESIQAMNQLGMLGYTTQTGDQPADPATSLSAATPNDVSAVDMHISQRGSKESRRSWTSKHKPHACAHPGCRKSYFFVHDLRRHLRQKHGGMDYNETLGKYEPASEGEVLDQGGHMGDNGGGGQVSPMQGHHHLGGGGHDDDGSNDESDDNEEDDVMAMALTGSGGEKVAT